LPHLVYPNSDGHLNSEVIVDFQFTPEQLMVRDMARDFAARAIAPIAAQIDETGEFPYSTVKQMGALGLMGLMTAEEYGGAGADTIS
jgi:alkylation response protein AidB-like acyl-CoA dehydrogenase